MTVNGFTIEERRHNGKVWYTVYNDYGFNKFYTLEDAVRFAASFRKGNR